MVEAQKRSDRRVLQKRQNPDASRNGKHRAPEIQRLGHARATSHRVSSVGRVVMASTLFGILFSISLDNLQKSTFPIIHKRKTTKSLEHGRCLPRLEVVKEASINQESLLAILVLKRQLEQFRLDG